VFLKKRLNVERGRPSTKTMVAAKTQAALVGVSTLAIPLPTEVEWRAVKLPLPDRKRNGRRRLRKQPLPASETRKIKPIIENPYSTIGWT
jgi:hypothetical protein